MKRREKAPMKSGSDDPAAGTSGHAGCSYRPLPWKRNEGHPGPARALSVHTCHISNPSPWELHKARPARRERGTFEGSPGARNGLRWKTDTSLSAIAHPELCFAAPKLIIQPDGVKGNPSSVSICCHRSSLCNSARNRLPSSSWIPASLFICAVSSQLNDSSIRPRYAAISAN